MKIKKGLINQVEQQLKEEERQEQLRKKHGVKDEDTLIVEKKSPFLLFLTGFLKAVFSFIFILLCAIGLISLYYDDIRTELMEVILPIIDGLPGTGDK